MFKMYQENLINSISEFKEQVIIFRTENSETQKAHKKKTVEKRYGLQDYGATGKSSEIHRRVRGFAFQYRRIKNPVKISPKIPYMYSYYVQVCDPRQSYHPRQYKLKIPKEA
ncbi:hypothetical protein AYI70_g7691 [Smittium culicis]|uniref:Uncharacterized protein n=1 Tax=Smittium culicis TaxID=133412 RepID=A0A1R1XJG6_9FUNG|nr:hypothetical protein AYI70_g7691 [Smittium culicis]